MPIHPYYQLLHSGYDYLDILLDLYGERDEDGVEVCDVALVGDKRSLVELMSKAALQEMTEFVERQDAVALRGSRDGQRIGWAVMDRSLQRSPGP